MISSEGTISYALECKNPYSTNFDAPDAHFDKLCLFSDAHVENLGKSETFDV
jgi:hypothetical protein